MVSYSKPAKGLCAVGTSAHIPWGKKGTGDAHMDRRGQKGSEGHKIWRTPFSSCASLESMLFLWQTLQWVSGSTRWANKIFFYLKELEESLQNRCDRCGGQKFTDYEIRPLSQNKNRNKKIQGRWILENWFSWHKIKFRKHAFFFLNK